MLPVNLYTRVRKPNNPLQFYYTFLLSIKSMNHPIRKEARKGGRKEGREERTKEGKAKTPEPGTDLSRKNGYFIKRMATSGAR